MTTEPTAATTLQGSAVDRPYSIGEIQSATEFRTFLRAAHDLVDSRESSSELLRGRQSGDYRFHAWRSAQTDSDAQADSSLLLDYQRSRSLAPRPQASCDLSERLIYRMIDPMEKYRVEFFHKLLEASDIRMSYKRRIDQLSRSGAEEDVTLNQASEHDFWSFIDSSGYSRRAGVVLMDNGDLRAVWRDDGQSHLALHFLGDRSIRYVIFRRRPATRSVSRVAGTDTFEGVKQQVRVFDLGSLVNE